jgi:hypothetical protein
VRVQSGGGELAKAHGVKAQRGDVRGERASRADASGGSRRRAPLQSHLRRKRAARVETVVVRLAHLRRIEDPRSGRRRVVVVANGVVVALFDREGSLRGFPSLELDELLEQEREFAVDAHQQHRRRLAERAGGLRPTRRPRCPGK